MSSAEAVLTDTLGAHTARQALDALRAAGFVVHRQNHGRPAYGWRREGGQLVAVNDEQRTISEIERLFQQRLPLRDIAEVLNGQGRRTRRGAPWHHEDVRRVIAGLDRGPGPQQAGTGGSGQDETKEHA